MCEILNGADKQIVFLWRLGGDSEVMGRETAEIGGVADEDVVVPCQIVFELSGGMGSYLRQYETGLCLIGFDAWYLVKALTQPFRLCEVGVQVG